jgi:predicted RND superfamily exporter protein
MDTDGTDPDQLQDEFRVARAQGDAVSKLVAVVLRRRFVLLGATIVAALLAVVPAGQLRFDQSIESLYAQDDTHLAAFRASRKLFGGDEFVFVAYEDPQLFGSDDPESELSSELSEGARSRILAFAGALGRVKGVQADSTQHLVQALEPAGRLGSVMKRISGLRRRVLELVEGVLVGEDRRTVAIVLRLSPAVGAEATANRAATFAEIRRLAEAHSPVARVVGEPVQVHDMFRYVEEDGRTLFWWSLGLLALVILVLFRNLRWVVLPLAVVLTAILWTEALLVLSGMKLSMVSSMLNSLVTIIGVATCTHVTVHYREHRGKHAPLEALSLTMRQLVPAIFWTGATTAIGFAALLSSNISPVRSFGIMMGLATLLVLLAALLLLPGGILLGRLMADPGRVPGEGQLTRGLQSLARAIRRRPAGVLIGVGILVGVAGAGLTRLEVETDFSENFRPDSPIRLGLDFFETKLGGAGNWEVNFPVPEDLDQDRIDRVEKLAERLRSEVALRMTTIDGRRRLTKVMPISDGLEMVPHVPFLLNTLKKRLRVLDQSQPEYVSSLYNSEAGRMRIVLRSLEREQAGEKRELIERVEAIAREEFPEADPGGRPVEATGLYVLLTFLIESLLRDQVVSFVLAAIGITVMMALAFRSVSVGLVALLPNLFPIVMVIGAMGWMGLPVNIATAMIASVSLGLTVDSSIHYISGFRRARAEGDDVATALERTHAGVGRAVVLANLALVVGFSVLTLSHFLPLVYFGILVSVAMLGGLAGNLVLLPVLLAWVERDR